MMLTEVLKEKLAQALIYLYQIGLLSNLHMFSKYAQLNVPMMKNLLVYPGSRLTCNSLAFKSFHL